jgi:hypothetical protein
MSVRPLAVVAALLCSFPLVGLAAAPAVFPAAALAPEAAPPVIDGVVDDEAWSGASVWDHFTQQEPLEGQPASERTEVRVLFGRDTLYISVICFDSDPSQIVLTQSRRDADLNDTDSIQVVLDTYNDSQNGFVFGTNPAGVQYDGQVAGEGLTGGFQRAAGAGGSQRGAISGFNPNWDGTWTVRSRVTARGWETEMAIPFRTLRYAPGEDRTWGFNVQRNIRRRNEVAFLAPIPQGSNLHRVSLAARLTGLNVPQRRELKLTPFAATRADKDYVLPGSRLARDLDAGLDVKWGITPTLTADFTVNTDFAQVEADDEQINLTRFPVFFPEKRTFFLENASTFQFGNPQQLDLFFSRRIGLSRAGDPIDILGGARVTGRTGPYNVGVLSLQTEEARDARAGALIAPANHFTVARLQRQVGRSNAGAILVNRQATSESRGLSSYNRAYGVDTALQVSPNGKLFAFVARTDSAGGLGSDYAGRVFYTYTNPTWAGHVGLAHIGERFNPEVGFLSRAGIRRPEARIFWNSPRPAALPWVRRFSPHVSYNGGFLLDGRRDTTYLHVHPFEVQMENGGRFGYQFDFSEDRPLRPFTVFSRRDRAPVIIPPGLYGWWQGRGSFMSNQSARVFYSLGLTTGGFYDGDVTGAEGSLGVRFGDKLRASAGYSRNDVRLPGGSFVTTLLPVRVAWSFTPLATLQTLVQYNSQAAQVSSNVRLALLDKSGTGLFVVYNDRRDTLGVTPETILGRSFVVKYTRMFDF